MHIDTFSAEYLGEQDRRINSLELLTPAEEQRLLFEWNLTDADYDQSICIHHLFERQVARNPHITAVVFKERSLTYEEVDSWSNRLAQHLCALGAGPDIPIGICVERSERLIIALLAVLKVGAACVPLDPSHPRERLMFMCADVGVQALITEEEVVGLFSGFCGPVIRLDASWKQIRSKNNELIDSGVQSRNLAYVMYTSGSSGQPNGVMVEHRSVVNFLLSMQHELGLTRDDRMFSITTPSFDIAFLELFLPLTVGAQVIVGSREATKDGVLLAAELSRQLASVMQATPATWRMLLESGWRGNSQLKVLCGGEAFPRELANELIPRAESVWNLYGPTEATIWATAARVAEAEGPVFIGRPISNTRVYILDQERKPVPIGVPGELYIAGHALARGYWDRPQLTAQRFIELPSGLGRAYKTGDIARYWPDGRIEYLGRKDSQIKLRGYRIEPAEIESALRNEPGIKEAVAVPWGDAADRQIIAYLERDSDNVPTSAQLRSRLKEKLPQYMVPSRFIWVDRLPLNLNGKVDRRALPNPTEAIEVTAEVPSSGDQIERQLTKIWEDLLGIKPIQRNDNFFDLGGHSMLAVRLFSRIEKEMGCFLGPATLFQSPTIELLADTVRNRASEPAWSPLVELQLGTSRPFFCVHSLGANLLSYRKLAALSGPGQQFYGLQPYGLDGRDEPQTSIYDMARSYLVEVRRVQPEGPYQIGGVCLGGVIAFEMAQQLRAQGQQVCLLLLIDSDYPAIPEHLHCRSRWLTSLDSHLGEVLRLPVPEQLTYLITHTGIAAQKIATRWLPRRLREKNESSLTRAINRVIHSHFNAAINYTPKSYPGKVTLFCSSHRSTRSYEDRRLAWSKVATAGLEVHLVPGDHMSMMEEPNVQILAGLLRACLERASSPTDASGIGGPLM